MPTYPALPIYPPSQTVTVVEEDFNNGVSANSDVGPVFWQYGADTTVSGGRVTTTNGNQFTSIAAFTDEALTLYGINNNPHSELFIRLTIGPRASVPPDLSQGFDLWISWASDSAWTEHYARGITYANNGGLSNRNFAVNEYDHIGVGTDGIEITLPSEPLWPAGGASHVIELTVTHTTVTGYLDDVLLGEITVERPNNSAMPYNAEFYLSMSRLDVESIEVTNLAGSAAGITLLGEPAAYPHFKAATVGRVTQWTYPYTAYVATPLTPEPYGFKATKFGFPQLVSIPIQPTNTFCKATGFKPTLFGAAATTTDTDKQASGFAPTMFGTPVAQMRNAASGFAAPVQFGQGSNAMTGNVSGFLPTLVPVATSRRTQLASSTYRAPRWGTPTVERSNTFEAYGINGSGRFGRPKGFQRFNYPVTGLRNTQHGAHTSFEMRRATMIPPTQQQFGKPLLMRTPLC